MANIIVAQLLYLDAVDPTKVCLLFIALQVSKIEQQLICCLDFIQVEGLIIY